MIYRVALHESEEGFAVSCPGLPGCWSQGQTKQEALESIRQAIGEYMKAERELRVARTRPHSRKRSESRSRRDGNP